MATSFLYFSLFSTALWDLANSRPVHSLMLSSHLFLCLPCLLPPLLTVPCKMVLARPDERETCSYYFSFRLFTMLRRFSCGPIACWILAQTSSFSMVCILLRSCAVRVHNSQACCLQDVRVQLLTNERFFLLRLDNKVVWVKLY